VASSGGEATLTSPAVYVHESLDLNLEQIYVTVTRRGKPVSGLGPKDFRLKDDGVPQTLVTAAAGETPFTAVVLMDSSISMKGRRLRRALEGVQAFLEGMEDLDEARVAVFSHELLYSTPFSQDASVLDLPILDLPAGGGTAVYDHLYWALRVLEPRFGRPVVILLSDGEDVHSILDMTEVREEVRRSQAILYWLRIEDPFLRDVDLHGSFRDVEANRRQTRALERSVRESGGRVQPVSSGDAIHRALQEVLAELRAEYALGYYPELPGDSGADGRWHTLEVEVRGAKVSSREGYFAFP
jgi:Ca-activated chloride channel family protein